jgi:monoamine oxidase
MKTPKVKDIQLNTGYQDGLALDVAIIGAGVSGLYSAYRLTNKAAAKDSLPKVHVFEMGHRIGGRLFSVTLPKMNVSAELGGMRYLDSQQIVTQLIENVFKDDLHHIDFPMGDDSNLFVYLRKQRLIANQWLEEQRCGRKLKTRYYLNEADEGYSADQLFNKVVYEVLMADPAFVASPLSKKVSNPKPYTYQFELTARDWDHIKPTLTYCFEGPYKGSKVNDLGFWNLIKDRVSEEGYTFLAQAGGYYSNTINWNAAEAFPYMVGDFSDAAVTYKTIKGGYDLIAYALAYHYLESPDATIWSENQLLTFKKADTGDRKYQLTFRNILSGETWNVFADKIILAMPRKSLELIDQDCFFFKNETLQSQMEAVIMEPSFKIIMGFDEPWWTEDFGATSGHSVTDLPIRQCYYFGTDHLNSNSLFLASYNDMRTVTFWKALEDNHPDRHELKGTKRVPLKEMLQTMQSLRLPLQASKVMVREVMHQVRELHGKDIKIPKPYVAWYKDWSDDPFGGGYHAWKAAYSVKEVMEYMRHPDAEEDIHICGEAYSDQQGWVEGALCEAEKMLQESFSLQRPSWLPKDYYMGW